MICGAATDIKFSQPFGIFNSFSYIFNINLNNMKVVYINKNSQDENTIEPQLIDGKILHWKVGIRKFNTSLQDFIEKMTEFRPDVEYILIYDVISTTRYFCDQGCKPGSGCKKDYSEDDHAIFIDHAIIKKENLS